MPAIKDVLKCVLEMQRENEKRLLWSDVEIDAMVCRFSGESLDDIESFVENEIVKHMNFLRFVPDGIKRAKGAYAENAPEWWKTDLAIAASIADARGRLTRSPPKKVFTPDEVVNLDNWQRDGKFHPFTCPNRNDGNHRDMGGDLGALIPTVRGWVCPFCGYTQLWAHGFMKGEKPNDAS